ncbi:transporter substrate-binding domain-containing protein [Pseudomonas taiwanensis]|uniref:Transporter substrate-binding domain-containing protein n=1 Tax=Pseudomonas taiwanensis TaxID=470150 RepID=A0ABR6V5P1_9PSED|nr:transporter substrate-binding domain-containing protein [Pseudomonas taiwanensis]MBC3475802.1 transporter substrate-binding domain-containing protein [Pseudomonas taiwanensis]
MKSIIFIALGLIASSVVHADALSDIKARGSIRCATLTDSVPLGYQDPTSRQLVGLDVDVCKGVAKHLGVKADIQGVAVSARIPSLMTGRVDLVAAALGYTEARASQIDFSSAYYQIPVKILVRKDSNVSEFSDLNGKRISAIKSSTPELYARQQVPGAKVIGFEDAPGAFMALEQNKVQGMAMTEPAAIRFHTRTESMHFLAQSLHFEPSCIGIKKGETSLTAAVDGALKAMEDSGELQAIWDHWYGPETEYKLAREKKLTAVTEFR